MGKTEAKKQALEGKFTARELLDMVEKARPRGGMSRVNPNIPLPRVLDIYAAALAERQPDEKLKGEVQDVYTGKMRHSKDALIVQNILRDCA